MSVYTLFSNGKLTMGDDTDIFSGTTDQTLETVFNSVEESQKYLDELIKKYNFDPIELERLYQKQKRKVIKRNFLLLILSMICLLYTSDAADE